MKLRRLAGRGPDDFDQTIPTIDGGGGLRILKALAGIGGRVTASPETPSHG
jgi:hypothetical protein